MTSAGDFFFEEAGFGEGFGFVVGREDAVVVEGVDVAFENAGAPVVVGGFVHIVSTGGWIVDTHDEAVVGPGKFFAQCQIVDNPRF